MDLKKITLDDFMCINNCVRAPADQNAFDMAAGAAQDFVGEKIRDLNVEYSLHYLMTSTGDTCILYNGELIGFYWGEMLAINTKHQGKKLSVPLIVSAVKNRPPPSSRSLSSSGEQVLIKAWNVENEIVKNPWP